MIKLPRGRKIFQATGVRPYHPQKACAKPNEIHLTHRTPHPNFNNTRIAEVQDLIDNGTFLPADKNTVPYETIIFGSPFIDDIKRAGLDTGQKSRPVAHKYNDTERTDIAPKSPTVQRSSPRLLLILAASVGNTSVFSRAVTQAYIQSKARL